MANEGLHRHTAENIDVPIALRFSNAALEMGFVPVPRLFLWFYPYLHGPQGESLDPREAFFLQYIIAEKTGPDHPIFRLRELPCPFPDGTRRRYASKIRGMGLVYSKAHYAATADGPVGYKQPPVTRIESIEWIMDPLFYNLSLVHIEWRRRREALKAQTKRPRVFYRLPDDYAQPVTIPPHLVEAVALEEFYRLNARLVRQARELLAQNQRPAGRVIPPTLTGVEDVPAEIPSGTDLSPHGIPSRADLSRRGSRDARKERITEFPSRADSARVLIDTTTIGALPETIASICAHFAAAVHVERYAPSAKEERRLAAFLARGLTVEQICAGITRAVERAGTRGAQVRQIAYCFAEIRKSLVVPSDAETGTPQPNAVTGQPRTESEDATKEPGLSAEGEWLELMRLVQEKNPTPLDEADRLAWQALADDYADLAAARGLTRTGLVRTAVMEAIAAGSVTAGFLAPNLARRILERWRAEGHDAGHHTHSPVRPTDQTPRLQYQSLAEYEADLERQAQTTGKETE